MLFGNKFELHVSLDLGSDTMKMAFAYHDKNNNPVVGKIATDGTALSIAIPSLAYYSEDRYEDERGDNTKANKGWFFGEEVTSLNASSFTTVVKIKELLALMNKPAPKGKKTASNSYYDDIHFPKFFFPRRPQTFVDYQYAIENNCTFSTEYGATPRFVCERYFKYIAELFQKRVMTMCSMRGLNVSFGDIMQGLKITVVYPPKSSVTYKDEYKRLVKEAFGVAPYKEMSSARAIGLYAMRRGIFTADEKGNSKKVTIEDGSSLLVFDMGEEQISVEKLSVVNRTVTNSHGKESDEAIVVVEGATGHCPPERIGGLDVDNAVAKHILTTLEKKETVGTPSYDCDGHVVEQPLASCEYLFSREVKDAKIHFSMHSREESSGERINVSIQYEVRVHYSLERDEMTRSIGVGDTGMSDSEQYSGVVSKIADYIIKELSQEVNTDYVSGTPGNYILLSGGLVETCSLYEALVECVKKKYANVEFVTLAAQERAVDDFSILQHEDSVYAPAVGGVISSIENVNVGDVFSYSYGTFGMILDTVKVIDFLLDKGDDIKPGEPRDMDFRNDVKGNTVSPMLEKDDLYQAVITKKQLRDLDAEKSYCIVEKTPVKRDNGTISGYRPTHRKAYLLICKYRGGRVCIVQQNSGKRYVCENVFWERLRGEALNIYTSSAADVKLGNDEINFIKGVIEETKRVLRISEPETSTNEKGEKVSPMRFSYKGEPILKLEPHDSNGAISPLICDQIFTPDADGNVSISYRVNKGSFASKYTAVMKDKKVQICGKDMEWIPVTYKFVSQMSD